MMNEALARFFAKVDLAGPLHPVLNTRCWLWRGSKSGEYGQLRVRGRLRKAHVLSWEHFTGRHKPRTRDVDHLCRVRGCVRPTHLKLRTKRANTLAGIGPTAINAAKTSCIRGHELAGANLLITRDQAGRRHRACRACRRELDAARRAA